MFTHSEIHCRYIGPAAQCFTLSLVLSLLYWFGSVLLPVPPLCFILIAVAAMTPVFPSSNKGLSYLISSLY